MALIRAHHQVFGICRVPESKVRLHPDEWTPVDASPPPAADPQTPVAVGAGDPTSPDAPGQNQED